MKFSVSPSAITHNVAFNGVVVDLENPTSTDPVTLSIGTNPGSASLTGTVTVNAVAGVAVFNGLEITVAGVGYTLVATAPQQRLGITSFAINGTFMPGVYSAAGEVYQPGYYYNFPPSGLPESFYLSPLKGTPPAGNIVNPATTQSVISAPFNAA